MSANVDLGTYCGSLLGMSQSASSIAQFTEMGLQAKKEDAQHTFGLLQEKLILCIWRNCCTF